MKEVYFHATIDNIKEHYSRLSKIQLREKRKGFIELRRFHRIAQNHGTIAYYTRLIDAIDELEHKERG